VTESVSANRCAHLLAPNVSDKLQDHLLSFHDVSLVEHLNNMKQTTSLIPVNAVFDASDLDLDSWPDRPWRMDYPGNDLAKLNLSVPSRFLHMHARC
jgi:hypothetical protein